VNESSNAQGSEILLPFFAVAKTYMTNDLVS